MLALIGGRRTAMTHHDPMKGKDYNLVSTLYHALQGVETSGAYLSNSENADDQAVAQFLKECRDRYEEIARSAKTLLAQRIG
jgi:hypothetical protein